MRLVIVPAEDLEVSGEPTAVAPNQTHLNRRLDRAASTGSATAAYLHLHRPHRPLCWTKHTTTEQPPVVRLGLDVAPCPAWPLRVHGLPCPACLAMHPSPPCATMTCPCSTSPCAVCRSRHRGTCSRAWAGVQYHRRCHAPCLHRRYWCAPTMSRCAAVVYA